VAEVLVVELIVVQPVVLVVELKGTFMVVVVLQHSQLLLMEFQV
jgi:hypothetical protein